MPEQKSALSRRTVLKGAAWSLPVIAVATAVPAHAASGEPTTTPVSVGHLVESSDSVHDTNTRLSGARVEECFPDNPFSKMFNLTATLTYAGDDDAFTLEHTTVTSGATPGWTLVQATRRTVTATATMTVSCYAGISGITFEYNLPLGVVPELESLTANISGVSIDGEMKIDGLVAAIRDLIPVTGPKVPNAPDAGRR
ncbi:MULTISPECIES: hypothetical protein [unclassified Microbacterium]|uniref:hypothetical protein n=1 Tax=unclassified Microbacterium TaxID=2609290 RepID=UPI0018DF940C|nr:hypothetical protein [Microbacterium sp. MAH-37]